MRDNRSMGDQLLFHEIRVFGDEGRFFGDSRSGKIGLDLIDVAFEGDDVGLQKAGEVVGDRLIDSAEGRLGRFRNREYPVEIFQICAGRFSVFRHGQVTYGSRKLLSISLVFPT